MIVVELFVYFTLAHSYTHQFSPPHHSLMTLRQLLARFRAASFVLLTLTLLSASFLLSSCTQEKMFTNRMEGTWNVEITNAGNGFVPETAVSTGSFTFTDDNRGTYSLNTSYLGKITSESGSFTWNGRDFLHCPEEEAGSNNQGNETDITYNNGNNGNGAEDLVLGTIDMGYAPIRSEQGNYDRIYSVIKNEKRKQIWKTTSTEGATVVSTMTLTRK